MPRSALPPDLIVERTSDQPRQVNDLVSLLMGSLWEAIALVVIVALVGFWDWRAALLMAASIPLTLAMAFGIVHVLHIELNFYCVIRHLLLIPPLVHHRPDIRPLTQDYIPKARISLVPISPNLVIALSQLSRDALVDFQYMLNRELKRPDTIKSRIAMPLYDIFLNPRLQSFLCLRQRTLWTIILEILLRAHARRTMKLWVQSFPVADRPPGCYPYRCETLFGGIPPPSGRSKRVQQSLACLRC